MASGNFFFSPGENTSIPNKQMTKCLSLDSNESNVIPPLGHCLPFWPASESKSQGQQTRRLCTCAPKNSQLWEGQREHMSWWLIRCLCWMPLIWKYRSWPMKHAMPMPGFIKSRINYIFRSCRIFSQVIKPRERARWRAKRTEMECWRTTHVSTSSLQFLGVLPFQAGVGDSNRRHPMWKAF